ncbi:MAG TPA: cupin domain-containing protein [Bryobacteraceae bacterium]|jgi:mannose-6-phosphate isomerase-like protein (cupin superfamily)|nr:cupin domain-containing protein [Bryobacteraceae bacterium]
MKKYSRRDLGLLLPALAATASAQNAADNSLEKLPVLKTKAYLYNDLPLTTNGQNKQRRMFTGKTHTGFKMESHQSDIAPGEVNHPPHQHLREEMMLIRTGTMELTISGKPMRLGPGDVGFIGSNEMHNAKNVGTTRAEYFIVNIGRDDI